MLNLSFSKKKIIENVIKIIFAIICLFLIVYFGLGYSIENIIINKKWLDPMFILLGISFSLGFVLGIVEIRFLNKFGDFLYRLWRNLKNAIKGNSGEKDTFKKLQDILDRKEYKIYPNFLIPIPNSQKKFDIDAVIVGPKGVICLEVKNINGKFDFIKEETYKHDYHYGNDCIDLLKENKSPSREALNHRLSLEKWLHKNGFNDIFPRCIILFIDGRVVNKLEPVGYYVVPGIENLADRIQKLEINPYFKEEICQKLTQFFGDKYLK